MELKEHSILSLKRNDGKRLIDLSDMELERRLHLSFLIVMPMKKSSDGKNGELTQITYKKDEEGIIQMKKFKDNKIEIPIVDEDSTDFCHEISIKNSISPTNFSYLILPQDLEKHIKIKDFELPANCKVIFVKTILNKFKLPYREISPGGIISNKFKDRWLNAPNYTEALEEIWETNQQSGIITHVVRTPTPSELENLKKEGNK